MKINVILPRAVAFRLSRENNSKKFLPGLLNRIKPHRMANEPALDKVMLTVQIDVEEKRQLKKEAKTRKFKTLSDYLRLLIHEAVKNVVLTPEDYEEIANQIRKNQAKRDKKRVG